MTMPNSARPVTEANNHLSACNFLAITNQFQILDFKISDLRFQISDFKSQISDRFSEPETLAFKLETSSLNTRPRCSKLSNISKLAHAGASRTVSPGLAAAKARCTASPMF